MSDLFGGHSMVAPLRRVIIKRPEAAFGNQVAVSQQWHGYGWLGEPDLETAVEEHRGLTNILADFGAEVMEAPADDRTTMDSVFVHDCVLPCDAGMILLQTGKPNRRQEAAALSENLADWGVPVHGAVEGEGLAEAGDLLWFDERTLLAGEGFRTNREGIDQLAALLDPLGVRVMAFQLPYAGGPTACLHLMSLISMLADDLVAIYRPLMPVPLLQFLEDSGTQLIDVPEEEYPTLGVNILALAPREVVVIEGNARTRQALETAGCRVHAFTADDLCVKGEGGPTCLTRPVARSA